MVRARRASELWQELPRFVQGSDKGSVREAVTRLVG